MPLSSDLTKQSNSPEAMLGALVSQQLSAQAVPKDLWPAIIASALQNGLAAMLLWVTKQTCPENITSPLWDPVVSAARGTAIHHILLEQSQMEVHTALAAAEIPSIWLKGIALARTIYPQPALRPMGDLDVLIPYEQQQAALNVVEALGYQLPTEMNTLFDQTGALMHQLSHHYHLIGGLNNSVVLELHHRLLGGEGTSHLSLGQLAWFWEQTQILDDGTGITILKPEAHLLYLCAHATLQHGMSGLPLRCFFDLHLLITKTAIDWNLVVDQAITLGWTFAIEQTFIRSMDFFSTPVPEWVFTQLQDRRPAQENVTRVLRLQEQDPRWEKVISSLRALSFKQKTHMILRWVFPSKDFVRRRYNVQRDWMVWFYYFYRWYDAGRALVVYIWKRLIERINR